MGKQNILYNEIYCTISKTEYIQKIAKPNSSSSFLTVPHVYNSNFSVHRIVLLFAFIHNLLWLTKCTSLDEGLGQSLSTKRWQLVFQRKLWEIFQILFSNLNSHSRLEFLKVLKIIGNNVNVWPYFSRNQNYIKNNRNHNIEIGLYFKLLHLCGLFTFKTWSSRTF